MQYSLFLQLALKQVAQIFTSILIIEILRAWHIVENCLHQDPPFLPSLHSICLNAHWWLGLITLAKYNSSHWLLRYEYDVKNNASVLCGKTQRVPHLRLKRSIQLFHQDGFHSTRKGVLKIASSMRMAVLLCFITLEMKYLLKKDTIWQQSTPQRQRPRCIPSTKANQYSELHLWQ